jgi:hypothetical protein
MNKKIIRIWSRQNKIHSNRTKWSKLYRTKPVEFTKCGCPWCIFRYANEY